MKSKNHHNIFFGTSGRTHLCETSPVGFIFLLKMPPNLRSKIILESPDLVYDVVEATQEVLVLAMVEQFERNTVNFLQEEYASDNLFGQ